MPTSHSCRSTDSIPQCRGHEISAPGHNVKLVFGRTMTYNYLDLVIWCPPMDATCRRNSGKVMQQSAYTDYWNDECLV